MRKLAIIMAILALGIGLAIALAQPGPPPPPPAGGTMGPPSGQPGPATGNEARTQMWDKFHRDHPKDAQVIMNMIEKYPELRVIFDLGELQGLGSGVRLNGPVSARERINRMERGKERNPEDLERVKKIQTLREQAKSLANKYNQTKNAQEKKRIEGELRNVLNQIYDLRLIEMKSRVQSVEVRLAEVKDDMNKFENDRNGVTESWFRQLTGKENYKLF